MVFIYASFLYLFIEKFQRVAIRNSITQLEAKGVIESYVCEECGLDHVKWVGRCNGCKEWNTLKLFKHRPSSSSDVIKSPSQRVRTERWIPGSSPNGVSTLIPMSSIDVSQSLRRITTWSGELNRVLGGGLVRGSIALLAGEPGIGKSTLLLQLASNLANTDGASVIYISGEENAEQIVSRANRLHLTTSNIFVFCDSDADVAVDNIMELEVPPALIIVDSVQTMRTLNCPSSIGSVSQIRESAAKFVSFAKSTGSVVLLVGHVTKTGEVAGPRVLEHMVDTVLYLEGSERSEHRLLRSVKNRFGATSEIGVFSMSPDGLSDVINPSELFMSSAVVSEGVEGAAIAVIMEGTRPFLSEIQCLVGGYSINKSPKRTSDGFPLQRLQLLCAVIEKRCQLSLGSREVYLNVVGGLRVSEPTADLAAAVTIISSLISEPIRAGIAFVGEIGLGGEIRSARGIAARVAEAEKHGFSRIIVPKVLEKRFRSYATSNAKESSTSSSKSSSNNGKGIPSIIILPCGTLLEALAIAFDCKDVNLLLKSKRTKKSSRASNMSYKERKQSYDNDSGDYDNEEEDDRREEDVDEDKINDYDE